MRHVVWSVILNELFTSDNKGVIVSLEPQSSLLVRHKGRTVAKKQNHGNHLPMKAVRRETEENTVQVSTEEEK